MPDDKPAQGYEPPRLFTETEVRKIAREEAEQVAQRLAAATAATARAAGRAAHARLKG